MVGTAARSSSRREVLWLILPYERAGCRAGQPARVSGAGRGPVRRMPRTLTGALEFLTTAPRSAIPSVLMLAKSEVFAPRLRGTQRLALSPVPKISALEPRLGKPTLDRPTLSFPRPPRLGYRPTSGAPLPTGGYRHRTPHGRPRTAVRPRRRGRSPRPGSCS